MVWFALPADATTIEAFDWLADEVIEAGGEAWTWQARPGSKQQHTALRQRLSAAAAEEYRTLIAEADGVRADPYAPDGRNACGASCATIERARPLRRTRSATRPAGRSTDSPRRSDAADRSGR